MKRILATALLLLALCAAPAAAQQTAPAASATTTATTGQMLLTIFFKHDQSKTLDEINEQLKRQKFYRKIPRPKEYVERFALIVLEKDRQQHLGFGRHGSTCSWRGLLCGGGGCAQSQKKKCSCKNSLHLGRIPPARRTE